MVSDRGLGGDFGRGTAGSNMIFVVCLQLFEGEFCDDHSWGFVRLFEVGVLLEVRLSRLTLDSRSAALLRFMLRG